MKTLSDFADEINKCSKCGLCQSVCPVYKITRNDCSVSRGKFVMLSGVLKGDLELNSNIEKYLDLCLKCGKCKDFCPSSIDVCKIFETAKYEYAKKTFWGRLLFFLESEYILANFLKILKMFNFEKSGKQFKKTGKFLYFKGCVNQINPSVDRALKKILNNIDLGLISPDFDCCGVPFLSSGNLERFEEVKNKNKKIVENTDYQYLVADCATCQSVINNYYGLPCKNILEIISEQNLEFIFNKPVKITFHKPCHLSDDSFIKKLFNSCKNVEYIQMNDYDSCCGFAGEFALKNNKISRKISSLKMDNVIATEADYVLTTCPACILGLKQGSLGKNNTPKIKSVVEFLADADKIINC